MKQDSPYLFVDPQIWHPKTERHGLEHPFFSLSSKKDIRPRKYKSPDGKIIIHVNPSHFGMPTMKDKDWLIYADSLIRTKMAKGDMWEENRPVRLDIWNFLEATNRGKTV